MTGHRRLSLRSRLLVLLIAVTAAFAVVMGGVTAFALARRLNAQFNADLTAAAAHRPAALAGNEGGYLAAAVSVRTGQVVLLTPGSTGARFQQTLSGARIATLLRASSRRPFGLTLADGTRVRAVVRMLAAGTAGATGAAGLPAGPALLVVAHPLGPLTGQFHGILVTELITGGALILVLVLGGRWLIGRGLAPLGEMAGTAHRIAARGDLSTRMPEDDEATEVGRLGWAINTMLDRIQQGFSARLRSEQAVRQFAADASHELRTPLTTIRGYAELYRQGALGPGQLPDAMRRIEQEAQRMSTLVAELLELARLDRTASLDLGAADLAEVVADAVADARAVEPGRPVHAQAPESLVAVVDEARIRQVLANLLGNVREHTPPGTAVSVRLGRVRGEVLLEVADAGPGMSPADAARAFDRFYRAADPAGDGGGGDGTARRRGGESGGGSGLGLSIVEAIARAHGGRASLDSRPGAGTRIRIWLPGRAGPEPAP